jgi:hypothetical protein
MILIVLYAGANEYHIPVISSDIHGKRAENYRSL